MKAISWVYLGVYADIPVLEYVHDDDQGVIFG